MCGQDYIQLNSFIDCGGGYQSLQNRIQKHGIGVLTGGKTGGEFYLKEYRYLTAREVLGIIDDHYLRYTNIIQFTAGGEL